MARTNASGTICPHLRYCFDQQENSMPNQILAAAVIVAALAFPVSAMADETGLVGGAVAGAVVGGPVGAVVGAVVGNSMTDHHYHHHCWINRYGNRACN
jgi:hypothetical protein